MPCYEVRLTSVEFIAENLELLKKALTAESCKYTIKNNIVYLSICNTTIDLEKRIATGSNQSVLNALKRAYSREVVKMAAKAKNWNLQQQQKSLNQYIAVKY